jgi:mannose-6-phosphate isomerase-like protein (cupin superfamily)
MSEAFFVLSGTVRLYDGNDWADGTQNDFLYVPPGGIHGFRNESDAPASLLMLFAPARHASTISKASPSSAT